MRLAQTIILHSLQMSKYPKQMIIYSLPSVLFTETAQHVRLLVVDLHDPDDQVPHLVPGHTGLHHTVPAVTTNVGNLATIHLEY